MWSSILPFLFSLGTVVLYSQPNPRHLEELIYDKTNRKLLLFGGAEMDNNKWAEPSRLYEWDGNRWSDRKVAGPLGRRGHGWVYDEDRKLAVLIGGVMEGTVNKDSVLFDIWHWDGNHWEMITTVCPVKEPEATYDPVHKRILVYGDAANKHKLDYNVAPNFELWAYKNAQWQKLSTEGPDIRGSRMMGFDTERKRLVIPVFAEDKVTVWEWDGTNWFQQLATTNNKPAYRTRFAFAYDPAAKAAVLFGGLSGERKQLGDFWKWNGLEWTAIDFTNGPSVRNSAHFACGDNQLFLYGGSVPKAAPGHGIEACNELWRWKDDQWEKIK